MNFSDAWTREQTQELASPSRLITDENRRIQWRRERHLPIADADKHAMAVWHERFPRDVAAENEFWAQRRAEPRVGRTCMSERHWRKPGTTWYSRRPGTMTILGGPTRLRGGLHHEEYGE
ncbi:uncharacterized protein [Aegilops tauschii subsp. strangulata]|uniref:uncharacterized protein n=1 Tax=Aegilops tauschii subsp. strangulata TaxID=200361 RepID=UPI003CC86515